MEVDGHQVIHALERNLIMREIFVVHPMCNPMSSARLLMCMTISQVFSRWSHCYQVCMSMCREEIADLTMEDIALAIAMESLEDIDGWVAKKSSTSVEVEKLPPSGS